MNKIHEEFYILDQGFRLGIFKDLPRIELKILKDRYQKLYKELYGKNNKKT